MRLSEAASSTAMVDKLRAPLKALDHYIDERIAQALANRAPIDVAALGDAASERVIKEIMALQRRGRL